MDPALRTAWVSQIKAEDYEAHMAAVGQAQANAALVRDYFLARPPARGAALLFVGAGTGQMLEFVSPDFLRSYGTTFADINADYLQRLKTRLSVVEGLEFETVTDDVEHSRLQPGFDTVLAILVLEHVDWCKAVATMCALATREVFVITQENPPALATAVTPDRAVAGTMSVFREVHPTLVPRAELTEEFARRSFVPAYDAEKIVADEKKMVALGFTRS
jgi:2-polyprenyl-3-methyl-5-hydroxy-6-metoxy-1,4-benzoquinol methylase